MPKQNINFVRCGPSYSDPELPSELPESLSDSGLGSAVCRGAICQYLNRFLLSCSCNAAPNIELGRRFSLFARDRKFYDEGCALRH